VGGGFVEMGSETYRLGRKTLEAEIEASATIVMALPQDSEALNSPQMFHCITLMCSSMAQSQSLAHALKKYRELGRFIRKIRLEGGFDASVHKIIVAAPNIKDIFLSLTIWSNDSVTGLCIGLPLMDPSRVIIHDSQFNYTSNSQQRQLTATLCRCIMTWRNRVRGCCNSKIHCAH
jgi:hypothetical protein